jgi:steroid delta-isomerase-like uncharacterized protein
MSTEANKAVIKRINEEVFSKGNLAFVDEVIATDYVYHGPGGRTVKGTAGFKELVTRFRAAFPDVRVTVENMVAEGDYVAHRTSINGTHRGDYRGIAPTGKQVTSTSNILSRFAGGKEAEAWEEYDMLGVLQQLGVAHPMSQPGT